MTSAPRRAALCLCVCLAPAAASAQTPPVTSPASPWGGPTGTVALPPPPPAAVARVATPDDPTSPEATLRRLRALLDWHRDHERSQRIAAGVAGNVVGAVALGVGLFLLDRGRTRDPEYGVGVAVAGVGTMIGASIGFFLNDRLSAVRDALEEASQRGDSDHDVLRAAEGEWERQAARSRTWRRVLGPIAAGVGVLSMGMGTFLLVNRSGSGTFQYAMGTVSLGVGALATVAGAGLFFAPDVVEQGWATWDRARVPPMRLGIAPVQGGAVAGLSGTF